MDVDVRELGGSRVILHVSLDAAEVQSAFDRTYDELSRRGGVPGFRPGKVPRAILRRHYDLETIRAYTLDSLLQERFQQACEQYDLRPLGQPEVEVGPPPDEDEVLARTIKAKAGVTEEADAEADEAAEDEADESLLPEEGQPFEFHGIFTVYPRPKLPDFSALKLRRPVAAVTDEQVQERLEQLRELHATTVELDRDVAAEGDVVTADVALVLEGEQAEDAPVQQHEFILGQREYNPPIDRAIIGHKVGDTVEVPVSYPEDYVDPELAGKSGLMRATITAIQGRQLPELNDDFARSLGDYQSMEDLRAQLRTSMEREQQEYAAQALRQQALEYLLENTEVEIPEELAARASSREFERFKEQLARSGMSVEQFAEVAGTDEKTIRAREQERAVNLLKLYFTMDKLIELRGIEATEEDVAAEIRRLAEETGADEELVRQAVEVQAELAEELRDRARRARLIDSLIAEAQIEDVPLEEYEAQESGQTEVGQADAQADEADTEGQDVAEEQEADAE